MKKIAFILVALVASVFQAEAQERKLLTAGTDVPVVATEGINADVLKEGEMIESNFTQNHEDKTVYISNNHSGF